MIIVTGASRGLGRAVAERLIESGQEVLGLSRETEDLPFESMACNVSDYEAVKSVAQKLKQEKKELTGLVNAAGIASMNLAVTTPPSMTQKLIQTNLVGTIHCCQLFAPLLIRKKAGSIINFSTIAVALGLKGESIYAASKAGVEGFSRAFAREMADFNIRVNCVAPGPVRTKLAMAVHTQDIIDAYHDAIPLNRYGQECEIAEAIYFLASEKASYITGQILAADGGFEATGVGLPALRGKIGK